MERPDSVAGQTQYSSRLIEKWKRHGGVWKNAWGHEGFQDVSRLHQSISPSAPSASIGLHRTTMNHSWPLHIPWLENLESSRRLKDGQTPSTSQPNLFPNSPVVTWWSLDSLDADVREPGCISTGAVKAFHWYTRTWKSVHMWNQGKNRMGRRAFRKSNKSMQPGLKLHGTHYVEVLLLDPWQCTFLWANFPNPHQDACAQLCPIILKIYAKISKSPSGRVCTIMSHNLKNIYIHRC